MSKNRNIADLLDANGDVKLASLDNIDLTNLNASHLTSGSIPDARVPASAVSQHATSFDDNKLVNDISTLALRQASNENKSAYNTQSMFVDVFQDSTGITNLTNTGRNNSEFMSTLVQQDFDWDTLDTTVGADGDVTVIGNQSASNGDVFTLTDVSSWNNWKSLTNASQYISHSNSGTSSGYALGHLFDFKGNISITALHIGRRTTNGEVTSYKVEYSTNGTDFTLLDLSSATASTVARYSSNGNNTTGVGDISSMTSAGIINFNVLGAVGGEYGYLYKIENFSPITARYIRKTYNYQNSGNNNAGAGRLIPVGTIDNFYATGSFESNAITAPSNTNSMGAIITYQDNGSTNNVLNTDIILKLSADGGSNYSTATLTAMPDFASGIKMAKVNDLTIANAGTSLKYKIEFANQASGTKDARIRGVSLQY